MDDEDDSVIEFSEAPSSELMLTANAKLGRPRDVLFDGIVQEAYESGVARRTVVSRDSVDDVVRGIKRGARHLEVSVSLLVFEPDEDDMVTIEFLAYPTQKRPSRKLNLRVKNKQEEE